MANRQHALATIPAPERSLFRATVKLAQQVSADPATNGSRIVSTTIRQSNHQGEPLSVGEWSRQTILQNSDWLIKIAKRDKVIIKNGSGVVRITFGNGYDALVAIDCEEFPEEISEINKIGAVVCISTVDDDDDITRLNYRGVVNPSDSIFDHLQACVEGGRHEQDIRIYIHTDANPWTTLDESIERTEIYRVKTSPNDSFSMEGMEHMLLLEEHLQATGKVGTLEAAKKAAAKTPAVAAAAAKAALSTVVAQVKSGEDSKHRFGFNPKQYILLSKAFNGKLSKHDIMTGNSKFTDKEVRKAERICKRVKTALKKENKKKRKMGDSSNEKATGTISATAQSEAPKKRRKKTAAITNTENDKAAKEPTVSNEKTAEGTKENSPEKIASPKDGEEPKVPAKETERVEAPKEKASKDVDAPKSPAKETKQIETPRPKGEETKSPTKERQKVDAPKTPTKGTQKAETPERKKRSTRSTAQAEDPKSPAGTETTETDAADTPKKQKSKHKHKDATPSAVETGPKGTIKKVAPEGKDEVETPISRRSRKRESTTLAEVSSENAATHTSKRRQSRTKGSTNKPDEPGQDDGATPKKARKR